MVAWKACRKTETAVPVSGETGPGRLQSFPGEETQLVHSAVHLVQDADQMVDAAACRDSQDGIWEGSLPGQAERHIRAALLRADGA